MSSVLITGASGGIGRACAELFAKNGYGVMACYNKNEQAAEDLCQRLNESGYTAYACKLDVTSKEDAKRAVALCEYKFGGLTALVNNAGIGQIKVMADITESDLDRMLNINVKGAFNVTQAALPLLRSEMGRIVNVSSMWGIAGASCEVHYSASKAALIGFTKALAKEVAPSGIRVNCIAPGIVQTDMMSCFTEEEIDVLKEETPLMKLGRGEDIARAALYLAEDEFMTGQVISPNGGFVI